MKTEHIIIGLIILMVVLFLMQKKEHAGSTQALSNEAVQNIAKVYADTTGTATFNNTKATGTSDFNIIRGYGEATFNSTSTFKGGKGDIGGTHFPWWDGTNFIRGPTQIDGLVKMNKGFTALSPNNQYELKITDDGNLVISKSDGTLKWASNNTANINIPYKIQAGNNQVLSTNAPRAMGVSDMLGLIVDNSATQATQQFSIKPI
jgi:hypothetical protein